jgi:hypothetical protein
MEEMEQETQEEQPQVQESAGEDEESKEKLKAKLEELQRQRLALIRARNAKRRLQRIEAQKALEEKKAQEAIKTAPPATPADAFRVPEVKRKATEPWRPASMLFAKPLPGMRSRWVSKRLIEKRREEGWVPRERDPGDRPRVDAPEATIIDGKPLSSYVTKREMILCDMPEELAQSREEYYRNITAAGLKAQKSDFARQASVGGEDYSYGDIKVER